MSAFRIEELAGTWSLITGATGGIGRATAILFARYGINVALAAHYQEEEVTALAADVAREFGVRAIGLTADLTQPETVEAMVARVLTHTGGRLDSLINVAGYPFVPQVWNTPLHEMTAEQVHDWFAEVATVDLAGARYCTRYALPTMMRQGAGSLVYLSSTPALAGKDGLPYTEAKAGLLGLMRDVARQYGPHGIRSNAIAPGSIRTPAYFDKLSPDDQKTKASDAPLRRWGEPEEVAKVALFLASPLSSFVTGQTIVADGGIVVH